MSQMHVQATRVIDARPETIYAVLADYRESHPAILPKQYFEDLTLLEGGMGAGTVFDVRMKVMGMKFAFHMTVSEPDPGRVMVETDAQAGVVTTFTVEPLGDGSQSRVSMLSDASTHPGLRGVIERWFQPVALRPVLSKELEQLAAYVGTRPAPA